MRVNTSSEASLLCPSCGGKGRSVKPVTIASLVTEPARTRAGRTDGLRFCAEPSCDVVYYHPEIGQRICRRDVIVRVGQKESAPPRPVCYCFDHTVEEIEAEVRETGTSRIPDSIAERCRQGLDRCEETNPQGACCLGNVRRVVKDAQIRSGVTTSPAVPSGIARRAEEDCCGHESSDPAPQVARVRSGVLAPLGAILSAIVGSACCWLPLLLLAVGVSAAGVGSFFAATRPYFLMGAAVFLALGFYSAYFRRSACGPNEACAVPNTKLRRLNRVMLWAATAVVLVLAFFPNYVTALIGDGSEDRPLVTGSASSTHEFVFVVEGMHCEACAVALKGELVKIEGVQRADVSYATKMARVAASGEAVLPRVREVAARLGYSAAVQSGAP